MITTRLRHELFRLLGRYDIMVVGPLTVYHDHKQVREFYDEIIKTCKKIGFRAYNSHKFTDPYKHPHIKPKEVYYIDKKLVSDVKLVIAYVGSPSTGTGQELEIAADNDVPIILVFEKGRKISRMVLGNPSIINKITFSNCKEALKKIERVVKEYFKKKHSAPQS